MKNETITIRLDGEIFRSTPDKLVGIFEARGYAAIRANEDPHKYWQVSEHIKREY